METISVNVVRFGDRKFLADAVQGFGDWPEKDTVDWYCKPARGGKGCGQVGGSVTSR